MQLYNIGRVFAYTHDIEIKKKDNKYGIIYLPSGEILLPFEYDNIIVNGWVTNNFYVCKNGKFGAVHFDGERSFTNDICTPHKNLEPYARKPSLQIDLECNYDYFISQIGGESLFFSSNEAAYLSVSGENIVIHFDEAYFDEGNNVWGKADNTLYLVSCGDVLYSEPFAGFRFYPCNDILSQYVDPITYDRLVYIDNNYIPMTNDEFLKISPDMQLHFDNNTILFSYYTQNCSIQIGNCSEHKVELIGVCDENNIKMTKPFAHTLSYIGNNKFIINYVNGKFGLCELLCHWKFDNNGGTTENPYPLFPKFIINPEYDFVDRDMKGCFIFARSDKMEVYNTKNNSISSEYI